VAFTGGVFPWLNPKFPTVGFWSEATARFYHFGAELLRSFSDDTAERLPCSNILERSRGGALATILRSDFPCPNILERSRGGALATIPRSDCPALLFWTGAVEELQRRYCGTTAQLYYFGAERLCNGSRATRPISRVDDRLSSGKIEFEETGTGTWQ
jgi:hypothetical protein